MRDIKRAEMEGTLIRSALTDRSLVSGISRVAEVPEVGVKGKQWEEKGKEHRDVENSTE